jgi:hypothetical protein
MDPQFERLMNVLHEKIPRAKLAFNSQPDDSDKAALGVIDGVKSPGVRRTIAVTGVCRAGNPIAGSSPLFDPGALPIQDQLNIDNFPKSAASR